MKMYEVHDYYPYDMKMQERLAHARHWLAEYGIEKYTINRDFILSVDVKGDVFLSQKQLREIPVNFGRVHGRFIAQANGLTSMQGCPCVVKGRCDLAVNDISSLDYSPHQIYGDFGLSYNKLESLHDIHKHIVEIGGVLDVTGNSIKSSILGVLLIKNLRYVVCKEMGATPQYEKAYQIINQYLTAKDNDINKCQDDLIDAGFSELARL